MNIFPRAALCLSAVLLLSACAATTNFSSSNPSARLEVKESLNTQATRTESFQATSFGNYEFRAQAEGMEPLYGVLPLKFNGGYLALDILFFAPAMFFNLREVYPFYEFDLEKGVVKYRHKNTDEWVTYFPLEAEKQRAKRHFKDAGGAK
ncbi:hypothetical protein [Roseateles oligotrophus]|uniref:Lipoprotein n=1 Tax=Roseateles oligotrophus TaxID=1769250 RepID=A0ABT2YDJ0_9BURK|nr:hypothetical protein [Roseateles oligotrophus]MCV2368086.1 hypothetical protein [Roseateles oligotrophus]